MTAPAWARLVTWYHLYPLGFLGAEPRHAGPRVEGSPVQHRLRRLDRWLDYLVDLQVGGLLLGPVFASETHGYDTVDYFRVDPRLGDEDDLARLFEACHRRGLGVLLDGVFNHVARSFPAFADVVAHGAASRHAPWFRLDFATPGPDGFAYETFEGHRHLVALNHREPAVLRLAADVARYWIRKGADGFRLDAAYAVPTSFWAAFATEVRAERPDVYLMGEVIHGDRARFIGESTLDAVTQYELWKAIWSSLNDGNFFELAHALRRHQALLDACVPLTFIGNHDVTRIASQLRDRHHLAHALALLFTLPGTPAVYAGDEQGWEGVKHRREGGDDEIRRSFPATPAGLGRDGEPLYRLHRSLIGLRRLHPFLADGRIEIHHLQHRQLVYEVASQEGERLYTALNAADMPATIELPWTGSMPGAAPAMPQVLSGDGAVVERRPTGPRLILPPLAWAVLGEDHAPART